MDKNKKLLLIFPPQWTPISPHYAIPTLVGQLTAKGYNAEGMDLNIDFFNKILTKSYLDEALKKAKMDFEFIKFKMQNIIKPNKTFNDYTFDEQIEIYRYNQLKNQLVNNLNYIKPLPDKIEEAVNTAKSENFYNAPKFIKALNIIDRALELASLPHCPTKINFDSLQNPFFKFNYENIKYFVFDKKSNMFFDYFTEKLPEIIEKDASFIAISLNSSSQIVPGLTLTYLLKKHTNAHINIGGNFFGRIADELKKHDEFFELFADSVTVEEGEGPIVETAKFINGEISIEDVPNLLYRKGNEIKKNPNMKPVKLNNMEPFNLDGYKLDLYFSPKIVLPYQSSRGCYWGKCSFCDQDFGQNFNVKDIDKVISEFKIYKEKYNITSFEFIDESVSPTYLNDFSDRLIKEELNISYFCDARLETAFSREILDKAAKAGLKMIMWGLESGSRKVMELINKGIDLDKRFEILKNTSEVGIWNFAFIFFGFPTETQNDAKQTIKMLIKNKDIIHSYGRSVFTMGRHAKLAEEPEKYGITKIYPAEEEFSPNINFDCIGMDKQQMKEILEVCKKECAVAYKNPLWMYLRYREWLFLYIDRYGRKWVSDFDIKKELG